MTYVNASNFRKDLFKYLDQVLSFDEPIKIATKKGNVVMMSEEEHRGILETLYIESIPGLKESILQASAEMEEDGVVLDWREILK